MKKITEKLAALLSVKSIITFCFCFCFIWLVLHGLLTAEVFTGLFGSVLGFYFGTQAKKP